ncbi:MAG: hypothetical protein Q4B54_07230 [Coriobacteriales bacterium]|nr:hypothetical protein [Coriobacteriales bacterium]
MSMDKRENGNPSHGRLILAGVLCLAIASPAMLLAGCAQTKTYYEGLGDAKEQADTVKEQADKATEDLEKMTQEIGM